MSKNTQTPTAHKAAKTPSDADGQGTPDTAGQDATTQDSQPKVEKALGRGLDVGTANLVAATQTVDGQIMVKNDRNAFLELPAEYGVNKAMLGRLNVPYVKFQDRHFVLGNSAFELAMLFGNEVRRPMQDGFLSAGERDAIPMMHCMIERLLGKPQQEGESVFFCIPAESIDSENDTVYHEGIVSGLVKKMGFTPHAMNEAHAVVYSELSEQDFTGITVSCGGGMFNLCIAYKTIPAVTLSVSRGGDWIDEHVSRVLGTTRPRATAIKESGMNILEPRNREEEAVALYARNLLAYVATNLKQRFELARDVPQFTEPVDVVLAGGTSLIGGFAEAFQQELDNVGFPLEINVVRRAEDAFTSVARGCLIAAALDSES